MHGHFRHTIQYVIVDRLGAFFYRTGFIWQQWQYHSGLSDQSAIRVRLRVALF